MLGTKSSVIFDVQEVLYLLMNSNIAPKKSNLISHHCSIVTKANIIIYHKSPTNAALAIPTINNPPPTLSIMDMNAIIGQVSVPGMRIDVFLGNTLEKM